MEANIKRREDHENFCANSCGLLRWTELAKLDAGINVKKSAMEPLWGSVPVSLQPANAEYSENILHILLNKWYYIPAMFNKTDYPFPCGGFVCPKVEICCKPMISIFTRRLGRITIPDMPERKGKTYAYFMCTGPGVYRAWEFVEEGHPSFKSTKFVRADNIECKGYALMAMGSRDTCENEWFAWNDHTGLMRCQPNSARILKKKYYTWEPTLQMVMFDGISCNGGRVWIVKTISYIGYTLAQRNNCWPTQAYFIDDLKPLPRKQQPYLGHSVIFWSDKLSDQVTTLIGHIRRSNGDDFNMVFGGIVVTEWEHSGIIRKFRAIAVAENSIWKDYKEEHWRTMAVNLNCHNWHEEREVYSKVISY